MASSPQQPAPAATERRESPRIALARVASEAALAQSGVTGLDGGRAAQHTTFVGTERLPGITVVADEDRYDVGLYLTAAPTDLRALADAIGGAIRTAAAERQLGPVLGAVHVTFTDLTIPNETTRA